MWDNEVPSRWDMCILDPVLGWLLGDYFVIAIFFLSFVYFSYEKRDGCKAIHWCQPDARSDEVHVDICTAGNPSNLAMPCSYKNFINLSFALI